MTTLPELIEIGRQLDELDDGHPASIDPRAAIQDTLQPLPLRDLHLLAVCLRAMACNMCDAAGDAGLPELERYLERAEDRLRGVARDFDAADSLAPIGPLLSLRQRRPWASLKAEDATE